MDVHKWVESDHGFTAQLKVFPFAAEGEAGCETKLHGTALYMVAVELSSAHIGDRQSAELS